jgi:hypothetical protein
MLSEMMFDLDKADEAIAACDIPHSLGKSGRVRAACMDRCSACFGLRARKK